MNREAWLIECIKKLRPDFEALGHPIPSKIRASCSWPSKSALAKKRKRIGEAWSNQCSADGTFEVFISPVLREPVEVAATLVHELVHCAVGLEHKHRGRFRSLAVALGLTGRMTETTPGPELAEKLGLICQEIGVYPHAELTHSNAPKKQTTRMIKITCNDCGCIVRMTRKWIEDVGPPTCACGGKMALEA